MITDTAGFYGAKGGDGALTISSVILNSIPGTNGRNIGDGVFIGAVYWFVYLR